MKTIHQTFKIESTYFVGGFRYICEGMRLPSPLIVEKKPHEILARLSNAGTGEILQKLENENTASSNKSVTKLFKIPFNPKPGKNPRVTSVCFYNYSNKQIGNPLDYPIETRENIQIAWKDYIKLGRPEYLTLDINARVKLSPLDKLK